MSLATLAGSSCITHGAPEAHLVIPYIACILSIGMRKEKYWSASLHGYYHASLLRIVHSSLCSIYPYAPLILPKPQTPCGSRWGMSRSLPTLKAPFAGGDRRRYSFTGTAARLRLV